MKLSPLGNLCKFQMIVRVTRSHSPFPAFISIVSPAILSGIDSAIDIDFISSGFDNFDLTWIATCTLALERVIFRSRSCSFGVKYQRLVETYFTLDCRLTSKQNFTYHRHVNDLLGELVLPSGDEPNH